GQRLLQIVEDLVNHAIQLHIDVILLGELSGGVFGGYVEANDRNAVVGGLGLGRHRKLDVRFVDRSDAAVDDANLDLVGVLVGDALDQGLDRALHVGLDDQVDGLDISQLDRRQQIVGGDAV